MSAGTGAHEQTRACTGEHGHATRKDNMTHHPTLKFVKKMIEIIGGGKNKNIVCVCVCVGWWRVRLGLVGPFARGGC